MSFSKVLPALIVFVLAHCFEIELIHAQEGRILYFGRVYDDPVRSIRDRQEFVDYIAKKLSPLGITGGKIIVVEKISTLAKALKDRQVDLYHDSPVPVLVLSKIAGSIPILRQWKYGEAEYEGVIVIKKNSGIDTLSDLKGKIIAFDEPHSTSGSVLPRMLIEGNGLKMLQVKSPGSAKPDSVGYMYGTDGSSLNFLITGRADAAATSYREFERLKAEVRDTLKVLAKTMRVPRQLIAVRKDLELKLLNGLKEVLLNMDKDSEGQGVLKRQQDTTRIDEIPPRSMERLKSIEKYVFSSLGKEVASW